ncbi:hypothetical protein ABDX87_06855 [Pseudomonas abietaniphila]|uniref:hypothetical protein n=1 Tax=Pseudomonas abietaniphila TaxID=89065 RepID=UPI0032178EDB
MAFLILAEGRGSKLARDLLRSGSKPMRRTFNGCTADLPDPLLILAEGRGSKLARDLPRSGSKPMRRTFNGCTAD